MNIKAVLAGAALALGMAWGATSAGAGTINWTLSGVTFNDGGVATGVFSTDDTTGALLSFDITTSWGATLPGFHYDAATSWLAGNNYFNPNSFLVANDAPGYAPYINFSFANPLTGPGSDALDTKASWECDNCQIIRRVTAGEAVPSPAVPEPATWAMLILGVAMVGFAARRRTEGGALPA